MFSVSALHSAVDSGVILGAEQRQKKFWQTFKLCESRTGYLFMQGTNLLSYYLCNIVFWTLTPFMFFDNCVWLGNYALFCELVYFCRGWQRSNVREPFCARYYSRGFFVYAIGTSRAWHFGVTLIPDSAQCRRVSSISAISLFLCVTAHKESGVPTTARNHY